MCLLQPHFQVSLLLSKAQTSSFESFYSGFHHRKQPSYSLHHGSISAQVSNGDGHGDFRGMIEGLDYLQELGVTTVLLAPVYESDEAWSLEDWELATG